MSRGLVVPMTPEQSIDRLWRMANHPGAEWFKPELPKAPEVYYRLEYPNGGTDPAAPDHAARWQREGSTFTNVTADCVALQAWAHGFDRKQPVRGAHIQGGSINCDFIRADVDGPGKCFERHDRPIPGCMVVYASLPDQDHDGDRDGAGHIGGVVSVPPEWDPNVLESWLALGVIDCAARTPRLAVQLTTGRAWFGSRKGHAGITIPKNSYFVTSKMKP